MLHTVVWLLAIGIAFFNLLQQPSIFQWGNPLAGYGWGCRPHGCEAAGLHWGWKSAANIPISVRTTTMAGRDLPRQYLISRRYLRCLVSSWNGKSVPKIFSYDCFFLVWISRQKSWHSIMGLITKTLDVMLKKWKRFLSKFLKMYTK